MTANGARGEVVAVLAGTERRLCLTLGALAEIETGLGLEGLSGLAERMRALSARDLTVVLAALLRGGGERDMPGAGLVIRWVVPQGAGQAGKHADASRPPSGVQC